MTPEEFKKWWNVNYFSWASRQDRLLASHLSSVIEFAQAEFNIAYEEEKATGKLT